MRIAVPLVLALTLIGPEGARAIELDGTVWADAATRHGIEDPKLLYAIALTESGRQVRRGWMQPWPWTLHVPGTGVRFFDDQAAMLRVLATKRPDQRIDVGPMQVNTAFHMDKVESMQDLADFATNVHVGAKVLRDCLDRHGSLEAGIGCYHSGTPWRAERYARTVLAFYDGLRQLGAGR